MPTIPTSQNERGVALVMAIVVLLVISALAAIVMGNLAIERRIGGHGLRATRGLHLAEAGIAEALSRIRSGDLALDVNNPKAVARIFLVDAGSLPKVGADTVALASVQPEDERLEYSTASNGEDALTISFKIDPATGRIVRHDEARSPALNDRTGLPVYVVTATGRVNGDRSTVVTEVVRKPWHPVLSAAFTCGVAVKTDGNVALCGYAHSDAANAGLGTQGRTGADAGMKVEPGEGDLPALWTNAAFSDGGGTWLAGSPVATMTEQVGFPEGPWEVLGLSEREFYQRIGKPVTDVKTLESVGLWLDEDGGAQTQSGSFTLSDLEGEGILYVDGDLTLVGPFHYRLLLSPALAAGLLVGCASHQGVYAPADSHASNQELNAKFALMDPGAQRSVSLPVRETCRNSRLA